MKRQMVCITCPNGCLLDVEYDNVSERELSVEGALCKKGEQYAQNEIWHPVRILTASVKVRNGRFPLVSAKTSAPIPKGRMREAMSAVRELEIEAPVRFNQVLKKDLMGMGIDLIATREVRDEK